MKIVLAGCYPETAKKAIKECFPDDWEIRIVSPEAVEGELADADVLIPSTSGSTPRFWTMPRL